MVGGFEMSRPKAGEPTAREKRLMPDGIPKWIRCYDNGGPDVGGGSIDRYTVVYTNIGRAIPALRGGSQYVSMSGSPYHPQGICQHGEHDRPIDRPSYGHIGRPIPFSALPEDCRQVVISDYRELWEIPDRKVVINENV